MYATAPVRRGPLAATGYAIAYVLLFAPAIALFCLTATAIPLVLLTVGIGLLYVAVPLTASLAGLHRRMAAAVIGRPVTAHYRPTSGLSVIERVKTWGRDPARWREFLWLIVDSSLGFVLAMLPITLLLGVLWFAVFPFIFWVTPQGVFDMDVGFLTINTQEESFYAWAFSILCAFFWWLLAEPIVRLKAHIDRLMLSGGRAEILERRVQEIAESRAESVDFSAAELRRIERDLHDGAQARLVALGMSLGMADDLMERDPEAARQLLAEARNTSTAALGDLRAVVRGIHPPVLADRGLAGAVQALAMDMAIPVLVTVEMAGRPPAPVESAVYFAIAECLANVGKHADAQRAWVTLSHSGTMLRVEVGDDGRGGARPEGGTGMLGVMRRLSAFDGTMSVSSPAGGPTLVVMEVPCELSSAKTTRSSATG
jgi:signal transduction histidine kinase